MKITTSDKFECSWKCPQIASWKVTKSIWFIMSIDHHWSTNWYTNAAPLHTVHAWTFLVGKSCGGVINVTILIHSFAIALFDWKGKAAPVPVLNEKQNCLWATSLTFRYTARPTRPPHWISISGGTWNSALLSKGMFDQYGSKSNRTPHL